MCIKGLLWILRNFIQIFTPFRVHNDTVLHFQLPLSCTPLIYMVLSFHLIFSPKSCSPLVQPVISSIFCNATRSIPLKWYHFKGLIAQPWFFPSSSSSSSHSFHLRAPAVRAAGKSSAMSAVFVPAALTVFQRFCEGETGGLQPILSLRYLIKDVC